MRKEFLGRKKKKKATKETRSEGEEGIRIRWLVVDKTDKKNEFQRERERRRQRRIESKASDWHTKRVEEGERKFTSTTEEEEESEGGGGEGKKERAEFSPQLHVQ